eukprot:CAMPEP_0177669836 /NCGR_PEP_ID=MMETSP0447-20121125/23707_1 /TAXON_ID=0 /ORGANISM="Stygamoeba regulata, Strain BSH-02190019" /LENGTH=129 /DNA_ID=CAMNT_0019176837 /DNA_START=24 /DNA_END=413 /DNA_ORIENTATION=+
MSQSHVIRRPEENAYVYEVCISVDADAAADYRHWLNGHIHEMLELPDLFHGAELLEEVHDDASKANLYVRYSLPSKEKYREYVDTHAPKMRGAVPEKFNGRFTITARRLVHKLETFKNVAKSSVSGYVF